MMTSCIECGDLSEEALCPAHRTKRSKPNTRSTGGYDWTWQKLSQRARRLQPFCTDCGTTDDLQADHSPEAWERKAQGKTIRLQDIAVVCGPCNRKRGAARGDNITRPRGIGVENHGLQPRAESKYVLLRVSGTSGEVV